MLKNQPNKLTIIKFFIIIFGLNLLIFNLKNIVALSNYKIVDYQIKKVAKLAKNSTTTAILEKKSVQNRPSTREVTFKEDTLLIPKINVTSPVITLREQDLDDEKEAKRYLKKGVLLYPFAPVGKKGTVVVLGHSAPSYWPDVDYDKIFSNLDDLEKNDQIILFYHRKKYTFEVITKRIFFPSQESQFVPKYQKRNSLLVLITCWPPGKDYKRLMIVARSKD